MTDQDHLTVERVGTTWVFSDGSVLPVVAGGDGTEGDTGATDTGATDTGTAETGATDTGATEPDPFDNADTQQFPRSYVEKLRNEAASYRTKASSYEEVFGGYSDEDRQVWLGMAKQLLDDPKSGAEWMAKVAEHVLGGQSTEQAVEQATAEQNAEDAGEDKPLTKAEMEKWYAEQRSAEKAKADQETLVAGIEKEATDLGYEKDSTDYNNLLWYGANKTGGDLQKAHEMVQADRQKVIDSYLETKRKEAGNAGVGDGTGVPTMGAERKISSLKDSHAAALERVRQTLGR